ncbi:MAG: transcription initiation factor IIB [Candidatus Asgardarchaeia archaeon]
MRKAPKKPAFICPECGGTDFVKDYERAEIICTNCGLVIKDRIIDEGPEWRAFDPEQLENRSRVGSPTTLMMHDKGLSTFIDWRNKDCYGNSLSPVRRAQVYRLRRWQRRVRISDATERNLAYALSEIERISSALGIPKTVCEDAAVIYRKAIEKRLIRGRSIEGVAAAALYASCRKFSVPRTLDEIATVARVSKKEIGRSYRFLSRELKISVPPTNPIYYVPRLVYELGLSGDVQEKAIEILKVAAKHGLTSGRGPTGIAAAAVYVASVLLNRRCTQREVAEAAHVTEVTVRNRYKELIQKLEINPPI